MKGGWTSAAVLLLPSLALAQVATGATPQSTSAGTPADTAQTAPQPTVLPPTVLPEVNVVGSAPLLGSGMEREKVPAATDVLTGRDLSLAGPPSLLRGLAERVPGVTLDEAQGNPFQPDLLYRGFSASPLAGNPQGLAVYVNGVRFNQPFGDTVDWDLIPDAAIDQVNVEGANPVFGLNALGGSISVRLKDGFTYHGASLEAYGGSFGRVSGELQYGKQAGNTAAYVAASLLHDGGWREGQSSELRRFYGDIGWRGERAELHLNIIAADNRLNGPGTVPVQLLDVDRNAQFTGPNLITNKYARVALSGTYDVSDTLSLQGVVYYTNLSQRVLNGNATEAGPCDDNPGLLCGDDGSVLFDRAGNPIPDFLGGGPYSELDRQGLDTNGYGASVQATYTGRVLGRSNTLVGGVSFDGAVSNFSASAAIEGLDAARFSFGPGFVIDQPDGSIAPVRVSITNAYYGLYGTDTLDITRALSLTLSGRLNVAQIDLHDQNGTALTGSHSYSHFNPGIGLTYRIIPGLSAYAGWSEANRAPTPAELSCASADSPCTLSNFFVADPSLKQVVAHSFEAGLRGRFRAFDNAGVTWKAGVFRTDSDDDILFVPSGTVGRDYFQNIGTTRRQGFEGGIGVRMHRLSAWLAYAYTEATFRTPLTLDSPLNPGADAAGQIHVRPGDRLPGIPANQLKFGASYDVTGAWTVGLTGIASSGQYLFGDEANLTPRTSPYVLLNLNTSYQVTKRVQIFGLVQNVLDEKYATYGAFSPTSSVPIAQVPGASDTRSLSPAPPIAGYVGVRVQL